MPVECMHYLHGVVSTLVSEQTFDSPIVPDFPDWSFSLPEAMS